MEAAYDGLSGTVQKDFTVRAGEEGIVEVLFERSRGAAEIHLSRKGEVIAAVSFPSGNKINGAGAEAEVNLDETQTAESVCASEKQNGRVQTVLGCGTYTLTVKAEEYGGRIQCILTKRENAAAP